MNEEEYAAYLRFPDTYDLLDECAEELVPVYDIFERHIFKDIDYDTICDIMPRWTAEAGCDEESTWSKQLFEHFCQTFNSRVFNMMLYYADTNLLVAALQDRFMMIKGAMKLFYKSMNYPIVENRRYRKCTRRSNDGELPNKFAALYSTFIYMCSAMDLITKVIYELESIDKLNFKKYPKMKSADVLYKRSHSFVNKFDGLTIFSHFEPLDEIMEIRNRIVHNGGFGYRQWIYKGVIDSTHVEDFIFLPDVKDGHIEKYGNHMNFYSQGRTANNALVEYVHDFAVCCFETIMRIKYLYDIPCMSNAETTFRYMRRFKESYDKAYDILIQKLNDCSKI